ncbi:hypothetical protein ABZW10_05840 [Kitasatospora sp. NPDC004723]|uniref:hypothetical protein n=1 Tax=Kitasatospora sp. NPDC004723 TaxID=3154288 RepID=UPI0033B86794
MENKDVRTLHFDTAESRRYLVLTLGMESQRNYESICQLRARMAVATSGATSPVVVSHKEPAVIALPGNLPEEFRLTLEDENNCLVNLSVINAVLTDNNPSGTH